MGTGMDILKRMDRVLVQVKYVTWLPASMRDARQGNLGNDAKVEAEVMLWAPIALNSAGEVDPSLLKPQEQGSLWAQLEVAKMEYVDGWVNGEKTKAQVLAVTDAKVVGPLESRIINQHATASPVLSVVK